MLKCLLNSFLLVTFSLASQDQDLTEDLKGIAETLLNENYGTVGKFHTNKTTIKENELKNLEDFLDKLDPAPKQKREIEDSFVQDDEIEDTFVLDDEISEMLNDSPMEEKTGNLDVKTTVDKIQLPERAGSPAFSIHADKVYILYPSLFQDPNIFGRFSIPQNINLDSFAEKSSSSSKTSIPTEAMQQPEVSNSFDDNSPREGRKLFRRQAEDNPKPQQQPQPQPQEAKPSRKGEKKRNVETHLTGSIVVLNQDVNENNQKESY